MATLSEVWPGRIPAVGQKAQRTRTVTARDIELFTEISGDRNPLHYDEEVAKNTRFGGIVVQGGITSAILNAVFARSRHRVPASQLELQSASPPGGYHHRRSGSHPGAGG